MPVFALVAASRCPRELYKSLYSAIIPKPCTAAVQAVMVAVAVSPEEVGGGGGGNTTASTPPPPLWPTLTSRKAPEILPTACHGSRRPRCTVDEPCTQLMGCFVSPLR